MPYDKNSSGNTGKNRIPRGDSALSNESRNNTQIDTQRHNNISCNMTSADRTPPTVDIQGEPPRMRLRLRASLDRGGIRNARSKTTSDSAKTLQVLVLNTLMMSIETTPIPDKMTRDHGCNQEVM
jgi:hypothetical protein